MSTRHSFLSTTGLIRSSSSASTASHYPSVYGGPKSSLPSLSEKKSATGRFQRLENLKKLKLPDISDAAVKLRGTGGVVPLGPTFIVGIAIIMSLFFIGAVSFAFIGAEDAPVFQNTLNDLAKSSPGILLIGDNVDVDIDEPAVTVRWSILACGQNYTLAGSEGTHGSSSCGIPNMPLNIYVDSGETPEVKYDPALLPIMSNGGARLSIHNLYQFDSDHVLDVHEARLYPFDTYRLTTTLRAVNPTTNETVPLTRLLTLTDTSSFIISSSDSASYVIPASSDGTQLPSRDLTMSIVRPGEARFFALMLFGVNWMLAHATVAYVALAWKSEGTEPVLRYLAFTLITLLVIPGIRNVMPDAPGYDGVLIDQIGFFAQMLLSGLAAITQLATLAQRELRHLEASAPPEEFVKERPAPISRGLHKLRGSTASIDFRHMRNLSVGRPFAATVEPPTPIREEGAQLDPFAGLPGASASAKGKAPMGRLGGGWPRNGNVASASTTSLLPSGSKSTYSEWV